MKSKILHTLEYDKIIGQLSEQAHTSMGKELAESLVPSTDLDEVNKKLMETDEAVKVMRIKGAPSFGGIRDIRPSLRRARIGGMLSPAELMDIATTAGGGRKIKRYLLSVHENATIPALKDLCNQLTELRSLEEEILSCVSETLEILDNASAELAAIRRELRNGEARIKEKLDQMLRSPFYQKVLQETIVTIRNDRYVVPVKQEYRSEVPGIVHDQSSSGATLFIEPEAIVQMNNTLKEWKLKEEREIEKILRRLSGKVAEEAGALEQMAHALARLDFIFAKGELAAKMAATLPRMNDQGYLKLKRARHPLIPPREVVPIDLELGKGYTTMLITGPNTGGKTVTLKTVGLLSLMAMSGLFIPAEEESRMCVFDGIYADIGDEQSIEQNLSTFSSHLRNIISILEQLTPRSLVLFDEIGAGTDPGEGSALAMAILDYVHRKKCLTMATTHYSELKAFAYEREGMINASMEFDIRTLRPTYRLLVGIPGRSNAFAIAERLGLPREIIDAAKKQIDPAKRRVESMIASLEANRLSAEQQRQTLEKLREESERSRRELEEEKARFQEQKERLMNEARREAERLVAKARREADEIIAELRKMAMEEKESIKEHKFLEMKRRLEQAVPAGHDSASAQSVHHKPEKVEPGDEVEVLSLGRKGFVVEVVGENEIVVQLGIMKMKVDSRDVKRIGQSQPQIHREVTGVKRARDNVRTELDLRGYHLEDALLEAERFLDEALLENLTQVYIIHGKGTGILRNGLKEFLQKHKHVKSFRLGQIGEGGSGVTVVELK